MAHQKKLMPVALPFGRARLATRPSLTGSSPTPKTIGNRLAIKKCLGSYCRSIARARTLACGIAGLTRLKRTARTAPSLLSRGPAKVPPDLKKLGRAVLPQRDLVA